ncbi:MAG: trehalose-phosphatase [Crocinitomicaceae bacterium]|nr:trehalose-phosphatase [Crocinitomicaceae bacterium]
MKYEEIVNKFRYAEKKLILLDYDGTLVNLEPLPQNAIPSERLQNTLRKLINTKQTKVIILTGRTPHEIDKFIGNLPITIFAEHGALLKDRGEWKKQITDDGVWRNRIFSLMTQATFALPESFIEEKQYSLAWHYRNAESVNGYKLSRKLIHSAEKITVLNSLKIQDGNKIVEISAGEANKGKSVKYSIEQNEYDCILCIGDDKTDEDMFDALFGNIYGITIKVGGGKTSAKYRIETPEGVIHLLEQLCD